MVATAKNSVAVAGNSTAAVASDAIVLEVGGRSVGAREATVMEQATAHFLRTGTLPPVTPRFLACAKHDAAEAQRRWELTLRWRADTNVAGLLRSQQPWFHRIKDSYPHYFHGRSREGCSVYYELLGNINLKKLFASGVTHDALVRHYVFSSEFLYQYLNTGEEAKTITVLDCAGVRLLKLPTDVLRFIKTANALLSSHYPERAFKVLIVNAPVSFTVVWKVVKGFIDKQTLAKIKVVRGKRAVLSALKEHIDVDDIPKRYGGNSNVELGHSEEERVLADLVQRLRNRHPRPDR